MSLNLLGARDKRLLIVAAIVQMATALLDLVGVLLIGVVGVLSVSFVEQRPPPAQLQVVLSRVGLAEVSPEGQVAIVASAAALVLMSKSLISPILLSRILGFLALREVAVATRLSAGLLHQPLGFLQQRSSQETAYALVQGATQATMILLSQAVIAVSEVALLAVLSIALLVVNPGVALAAIGFFAFISVGLQRLLAARMGRLSALRAEGEIGSLDVVQEIFGSYREIVVSDRRDQYLDRLKRKRAQVALAISGTLITNLIPKYAFEGALVVGAFALAVFLLATESVAAAVGTLALFLAASTRLIPALLRLQTATLALRSAASAASRTYSLASDLSTAAPVAAGVKALPVAVSTRPAGREAFSAHVRAEGVAFAYPNAIKPAVRDVSFEAVPGQVVAFLGASGAGKSTLADLILGILQPQSGSMTVNEVPPIEAVSIWPGALAYVPQDVRMANSSVRANVALGIPREATDDSRVWRALERAHMSTYVHEQPLGLDTPVGEGGLRLSGGQRQRIGIARALYSDPHILVLDEATSALDAETEQAVSETINGLGSDKVAIVIAHRLSTVRDADLVIYLEAGRPIAAGSFEEVCAAVPSLQRQVKPMESDASAQSRIPKESDHADRAALVEVAPTSPEVERHNHFHPMRKAMLGSGDSRAES